MAGQNRQIDRREFAARIGVRPDAITKGVRKGTYPQPDGRIGDRPWWWESTIDAWTRPKNGRPAAASPPHAEPPK